MKKLLSVSVAVVLALVMFGCGFNNEPVSQEWEEVFSVTYGDKTVTSSFSVSFGEFWEISRDEYAEINYSCDSIEEAQLTRKLYTYSRNNSLIEFVAGDLARTIELRQVDGEDVVTYLACQITEVNLNILKVKILNNREFLLQTDEGLERIFSDNIRMVYFSD